MGNHMRKVALFAAFALSVAFMSTSSSVPASAQQDFCALNKATCALMAGPGAPGAPAAAKPAGAKKAAKKGGKKAKKKA